MRIVLDTNVLWDKPAMGRLRTESAPKVLPVVALAERARQYHLRGWSLDALWTLLADARIEVEPMDQTAALRRSFAILDDRAWNRLARDAFIAGHVGPGDVLWTRDVEDFVTVGVPRDQIKDTTSMA